MPIVERAVQAIDEHPVLATLACLVLCFYGMYTAYSKPDLRHIPTLGYSNTILSYIDVIKYHWDVRGYLQRGYEKFEDRAFKVPTVKKWIVVLNGTKYLEDLRRTPEDTLSARAFTDEVTQAAVLLGPHFVSDHYHISVIRRQMTRKMPEFFDEMYDEAQFAFAKHLPMSEDWIDHDPNEFTLAIVCRVVNRICIGAPYCRDDVLFASSAGFAPTVFIIIRLMNVLPKFLHSHVLYFFSRMDKRKRNWIQILSPIIDEIREIRRKGGEDSSASALRWLIDEATGIEEENENLANRILIIIIGALSASTLTFTHAVYQLASEPQYLKPLREEIEAAIAEAGWTKKAMDRMRKLNSFIKEVMRMHPMTVVPIGRNALKNHTLSDGTFIPEGTTVSASAEPIHFDEKYYPSPHEFQGFRFLNEGDDKLTGRGVNPSFVTPTPEFLPFGFGSQACPGRFFASSSLKLILSYLLLHYDFMLEGANGQWAKRPDNVFLGELRLPNQKARLLVRKRQS